MKKLLLPSIEFLALFFIALLGFSSRWYLAHFNGNKIEEIFFTIKAPLAGAADNMLDSFIYSALFPTMLVIVLFGLITKLLPNVTISIKSKTTNFRFALVIISLLFVFSLSNISTMAKSIDLKGYIQNQIHSTTIYDDYYVSPDNVELLFPTSKPNLVYIVLESMETTFSSKEFGGAYDYNLIPNLTKMANNKISFSTNETLTGGFITNGTGFTVGSLVAQTSGLPLSIPIYGNDYSDYGQFLPGALSIGEILKDEGYNQVFLLGSDANFGGRKDYFTYHGDYEIHDYNYAIENNLIPEDYNVWWGYEDQKLFAFAKDELLELSKSDKPFNLTILTADTHHVGGYKCDLCEDDYPDQFSNVIACCDEQVNEFISWIEEQDFSDNTVIVITGDHNSMDPDYFSNLPDNYRRAPYNVVINSKSEYANTIQKSRQFNTMDWYPTTLGAMGVKIDGNRLGLGTNMFSDKKTLMEELGTDYVLDELMKKSKYYNNKLLYNKSL